MRLKKTPGSERCPNGLDQTNNGNAVQRSGRFFTKICYRFFLPYPAQSTSWADLFIGWQLFIPRNKVVDNLIQKGDGRLVVQMTGFIKFFMDSADVDFIPRHDRR